VKPKRKNGNRAARNKKLWGSEGKRNAEQRYIKRLGTVEEWNAKEPGGKRNVKVLAD